MKTVLLTGSSGFLGQHFKNYYVNSGWKVITIGRRKEDNIFWDAASKRTINKSDFNFIADRIVHCAAVNETMIQDSKETTYDVNVTLTRSLCDLAIDLDIKEFIYVSTFHVYGKYSGSISPNIGCNPLNDYGLTHYLSEEILRNILRNTNVSVLCLRPTNIYGIPVDIDAFNRWSLVPFDFVKTAMKNKSIELQTSGEQERNFVHVRNVIEADFTEASFEVRDIYGDETLTIKDFANMVKKIIYSTHGSMTSINIPSDKAKKTKKTESIQFQKTQKFYIPEGSIEEFIKEFSIICKEKL